VSSDAILNEARRLVSQVGVADFSVRELAKAVGIVPGTIHARFGNKHELLAALYLQRIESTQQLLDELEPVALTDVGALLNATSPSLSTLRREFVLHFEGDGVSGPRLRPETWASLQTSFRALADHLYKRFRVAAAAEGVRVVDGTKARRLVWTTASTLVSPRSTMVFSHADTSYRRFVATSLLRALAAD
jgi:AcrR family transcriptional regulator